LNNRSSLRIGVLVTQPNVQLWQKNLVSQIKSIPNVKITICTISKKGQSQNLVEKLVRLGEGFAIKFFSKSIWADQAILEDTWHHLAIESDTIQKQDIMISLTSEIDIHHWLELSANGIIFLGSPLQDPTQKGATNLIPGFKEAIHNIATTQIALWHVKSHSSPAMILAESTFSTNTSWATINEKISTQKFFVLLTRFFEGALKNGFSNAILSLKSPEVATHHRTSEVTGITCFGKYGIRILTTKIKNKIFKDRWRILVGNRVNYCDADANKLIEIPMPKDVFWADPFLFKNQQSSTSFIFFEEYPYRSKKGHISVIEINPTNFEIIEYQKIIEEKTHLSYPFIFEIDKKIYLTCENMEEGCVPLYECEKFPKQWKRIGNMLENVKAVDPTVIFYNGLWWLFLNIKAQDGLSENDELFAFYATNPLAGAWQPHLLNPIVSNVCRARPAGALFTHNEKLIRPSQDCSGRYGRQVVFNEIIRLDPDHFEERPHLEMSLDNNKYVAVHTYGQNSQLTVWDACKTELSITLR